jgi:hypothetical protein
MCPSSFLQMDRCSMSLNAIKHPISNIHSVFTGDSLTVIFFPNSGVPVVKTHHHSLSLSDIPKVVFQATHMTWRDTEKITKS